MEEEMMLILGELARIRSGLMALEIQMLEVQSAVVESAGPNTPERQDRAASLQRRFVKLQAECLRRVLAEGPQGTPQNVIPFQQW